MPQLIERFADKAERLSGRHLPRALEALPAVEIGAVLVVLLLAWWLLRRRDRLAAGLVLGLAIVGLGAVHLVAGRLTERIGSGRLETLAEMQRRPGDPWPRGTAHVPLGRYGAASSGKGYLEPGGSFSPEPGSLGVSFWVLNAAGARIATSDDIPLDQTSASYEEAAGGAPAVQVRTPYYTVRWTARADGGFTLELARAPGKGVTVDIVLRGVGPAGGGLVSLHRAQAGVATSSGWSLEALPDGVTWAAGDETAPGWTTLRTGGPDRVESRKGWAFARLGIPGDSVVLHLRKPAGGATPAAPFPPDRADTVAPLRLAGADEAFAAALRSQVFTLRQGVVGDETRPGDPLNYPLEWSRDGAYVVLALSRAGQTGLAMRLARAMAPKDYFGGFGSEADSPGLALWMLGEISASAGSPDFDRDTWPHVRRKAELLMALLANPGKTESDYSGPVVPQHARSPELRTVAYGTRGGLIDGRMDWHRPLFYVNASAYAGLVAAADMATRLGRTGEAARWRPAAEALGVAWRRAFADPAFVREVENDRTAISGLWPFSIAEPASFARAMQERPSAAGKPGKRPLWTYFVVAEAHQWLRLGRPEPARAALENLWRQSDFPGLYTLWEGEGEENSFGLWKGYRGWVRPPSVTPHYWAAAEALLLQLAMVAEAFDEDGGPVLAIGAGVPQAWLARSLAFDGIGTARGPVSWRWDGNAVTVSMRTAPQTRVRLGPAFPPDTRVILDAR